MWECEFDRILKENPALETCDKDEPLILRHSLYGGRTDATKLYYKTDDNTRVKYYDIMSLYPYICKYFKFPVGHPTLYVGAECANITEILKKEGVIKCRILAQNTSLYHPVLPYRCRNKLIFALCRTCAEEITSEECCHDESEREFTGTWVIDEVRKAVEMGYVIREIYEFYEYVVEQYNSEKKEGGLFVDYINTFLKLKAEASGYPTWVKDETDEEKYIRDFFQSEGILLDRCNIRKNPGARSLAKLCLNSFWGKLTEQANRTRTKLISEPRELYKFLTTPGIEVHNLTFAGDRVVWLTWSMRAEEAPSLKHTNEVLGAYVTAGARLKLYTHLEALNRDVLYMDTDSVIFVSRDNDCGVRCGDKLGDLTDEIAAYGQGAYICEFVSGGPKNYAYKVRLTDDTFKTVCKVRGITLNHNASQIVNFDYMKHMILDGASEVHIRAERKIKRKRGSEGVYIVSEPEDKIYRTCFLKRRRLADGSHDSIPFGYINPG
jgi:hypothetical protein